MSEANYFLHIILIVMRTQLERIIETCSNIGCNCMPWKIIEGESIQSHPSPVITDWLSDTKKMSDIIYVSDGLKVDDWYCLLRHLPSHGKIYVILPDLSLRKEFLSELRSKGMSFIDDRIVDGEYHFVFRPPRRFKKPIWKGEKGAKVLIHSGGGFGDDFHAGRYADCLNPICKPILEARPETHRFMSKCSRYEQVIFKGEEVEYDYHVPIRELVKKYGKSPVSFPYFSAPDCDLSLPKGLKIGFTYRGHFVKYHKCRVFSLDDFKMFERCNLYCLHKNIDYECSIEDSLNLKDWYDTACYIKEMDYVISPDTALFHLSAGMGKQTRVFAKYRHANLYLNSGKSGSESYPDVLRIYWGEDALSDIYQSIIKERVFL